MVRDMFLSNPFSNGIDSDKKAENKSFITYLEPIVIEIEFKVLTDFRLYSRPIILGKSYYLLFRQSFAFDNNENWNFKNNLRHKLAFCVSSFWDSSVRSWIDSETPLSHCWFRETFEK
jgi:hypothetical protein